MSARASHRAAATGSARVTAAAVRTYDGQVLVDGSLLLLVDLVGV